MKKTILYTVIVVMAAAAVAGCGSYSKLIKSQDHNLQYREALRYLEEGKYQKTLTLLEMVTLPMMDTDKADSIMFYTGLALYRAGDFESSGMMFDQFRITHQRSPFLEEAEYLYAKGFYHMSPEPDRDQAPTRQAMMAIDEYLSRYPNSSKREALEENMDELMQKLYDKAYINARSYYKIGMYKPAIIALQNALDLYPESTHREDLMYLITKSAYEYASNSVEDMQRERYLDMMDYYLNYMAEFPDGKYAKELARLDANARKHIARAEESGTETTTTTIINPEQTEIE